MKDHGTYRSGGPAGVKIPPRHASTSWEVWWAWFPVHVAIGQRVTVDGNRIPGVSVYRWKWLQPVARRRMQGVRFSGTLAPVGVDSWWEYAHFSKAITQ